MLGLETHDVQLSNYKLEVGNVFTVEPGLYLEDEEIGVRIEDNVLVTEDGCINLSKDIIKEVFKSESLKSQLDSWDEQSEFLSQMFSYRNPNYQHTRWLKIKIYPFIEKKSSYFVVLIISIIGATPIMKNLANSKKMHKIINIIEPVFLLMILLVSTSYIVDASFNPFLYFRF